jgi:hypothetical protein
VQTLKAVGADGDNGQDESAGSVQGTAFRPGNHRTLRAMVSQI